MSDPRSPSTPTVARPMSRWKVDAAVAALTALASLAVITVALRLWDRERGVPFSASGDALLNLMTVRTMKLEGWYLQTPYLGAPFGQDVGAWPSAAGDLWSLVALKLLSLVMSPANTVLCYYILTFPAIAVAAFLALRAFGVSRVLSAPLAVAYSILPYHFLRGVSHLFLGAYVAIPGAALVAWWILTGRLTLLRSPRRYSWREWTTVVAVVLLMGDGLYYAAFAGVLWAAAAVLAAVRDRRIVPLLQASALCCFVVLGMAASALPYVLYEAPPGASGAVSGRGYAATEVYGLKIVNLFLPAPYNRVPLLAHLSATTAASLIPGERTEMLGVIGVVGLVIVALAGLAHHGRLRTARSLTLNYVGALTIAMTLVATVDGLSAGLAVAGVDLLRAWNRSSVVIAFFAMVGFGLAADAAFEHLSARRSPSWSMRRSRFVRAIGAAVVLMVASLDQTGASLPNLNPDPAASWNADTDYFQRVEAAIGSGTAVFQLPVAGFPEEMPVGDIPYYDQLRGYLHTTLRWSYGGIKGQQNDWQETALSHGVAAGLPALVAAGFDAVYVDRRGYPDRGAEVEKQILETTGALAPYVDQEQDIAIYDISAYASRLRASGDLPAAEDVLYPVTIRYGDGFYDAEMDGATPFRWAESTAAGSIVNPRSTTVRVHITGSVEVSESGTAASMSLGQQDFNLAVDGTHAEFDVTLNLAPGALPLAFSTTSHAAQVPNDGRELSMRIVNLAVTIVG